MENAAPIRAVSRTISVLQTINRYGSLSMMEIARNESLPYPTAYRIVQTLLHEGLIEQELARKQYRPTALVQSLAHGYKAQGRLQDCIGPIIRALTREVGWPVLVTERVGNRMIVVDSTHAETSLTFGRCNPGFTLPLLTSATGQTWVAHLAPAQIDNAIRWHNNWSTGGRMDQRETQEFRQRLAEVRENGYAAKPCMNQEEHRSASIAVPVLQDGQIVAVVTLVYFFAAMKEPAAIKRYLNRLQQTAAAIEAGLEALTRRGLGAELAPIEPIQARARITLANPPSRASSRR